MGAARLSKVPLLLAGVAAGLLVLGLALPLLALIWRTVQLGALPAALGNPTVLAALQLSLVTSSAALGLALLLGTPLAYILARVPFPGRGVVEALVEVPIVLPPAVAGIALLMAFGRRGILGGPLAALGVGLAFTPAAVVLAQCFVAVPFYVRSAKAGFLGVDRELEHTAFTLGASPLRTFWRVTVPLASPSLTAGAVLCWARALGEFGATVMFAGSFRGRTQTMPLAIYAALETDLGAALALGTVLVVVSVLVLGVVRLATRRHEGRAVAAQDGPEEVPDLAAPLGVPPLARPGPLPGPGAPGGVASGLAPGPGDARR
jgi:molybdate transport system permease protein